MKQEEDSEIIATICEYENSVAISDGERLTFRDSSGIIHLKGRGESTGTLKSYADRCNEYLRFGDEVDLAVCGAYSPYDTSCISCTKKGHPPGCPSFPYPRSIYLPTASVYPPCAILRPLGFFLTNPASLRSR